MACTFPVYITTPPSCTHYLTYTPLSQGVWSQATRHHRGKQFPCAGGVWGGGGEIWGGGVPTAGVGRHGGRGSLAVGPGPCGKPQEVPHSSSVLPWPPWRAWGRHGGCSPLLFPPNARRGGGGGCLKNVCAGALNPWSRWRHLKSTLGTPLHRRRGQGAPPRRRAKVKLVVGVHLKTPRTRCFSPRMKCQKGGWAGLAA